MPILSDAALQNAVDIAVFQAAKEKGIHRTVHAGEAGPAKGVQEVLALSSFSFVGAVKSERPQ